MLMLIEFLFWWYGSGWKRAWRECLLWTKNVSQSFSVGILLKTLFAPWKRIIALPGRSLDEKFRGMVDNLVSRVVGFFVRLAVLLAASVMILATAAVGIAIAVIWPLLPLLGCGLIVWGILG